MGTVDEYQVYKVECPIYAFLCTNNSDQLQSVSI